MNYPFPNCNSNHKTGKIVGAFLIIWFIGLLPAHTQTTQSPYIGNDSLRIIPLKESVLYLTQWNRLELQSTLYGKGYKPVIMQVSGAKYRMDDKEKNVLWMMPDSGSQKVTLRVGKYMKNGIAFKVKDFEFKVDIIKFPIKLIINDTTIFTEFNNINVQNSFKKWAFFVEPDTSIFRQCPQTAKNKYWAKEVYIRIGYGADVVTNLTHTLTLEQNWINFSFSQYALPKGFPIIFYITIYSTYPDGITSHEVVFRFGARFDNYTE